MCQVPTMTNHQEFHRIIDQIDTFFGRMGIGFTKKTQNPPFFYFVMFFTFEQFIQFNYYIMYHPADMFVKVQQFWGTMALAQVIIKGVNRKFHQHRMADLMQWFEEIYSKKVRDESQADLDKRLAEQNRQINNALWWVVILANNVRFRVITIVFLGYLRVFGVLRLHFTLSNRSFFAPVDYPHP